VLGNAAMEDKRPAFDYSIVSRALGAEPTALSIEAFDYDAEAIVVPVAGREGAVPIGPEGVTSGPLAHEARGFRGREIREIFLRDHDLRLRGTQGFERELTTDGEEFHGWAEASDDDWTDEFHL
jgi:hypothetical protein